MPGSGTSTAPPDELDEGGGGGGVGVGVGVGAGLGAGVWVFGGWFLIFHRSVNQVAWAGLVAAALSSASALTCASRRKDLAFMIRYP